MDQQQDKNWWDRNWKWFVPVGCLGSLVIFAGFVLLIICLVFGMMKSSDAYKYAVAKAKAHPSIQKAIGTPIEEGMFITGNINVSGPSGHANLSIPFSGPDGKGTIYAVATKSAGRWTFSTLVVEIKETTAARDYLKFVESLVNKAYETDEKSRVEKHLIIGDLYGKLGLKDQAKAYIQAALHTIGEPKKREKITDKFW